MQTCSNLQSTMIIVTLLLLCIGNIVFSSPVNADAGSSSSWGSNSNQYSNNNNDNRQSSSAIKSKRSKVALDVEEINIQSLSPKNRKERELLYEAYNQLHTLAQDFHKPFDAPAVIVVGHQTSGKSALIEALMGFQFNQVSLFTTILYLSHSHVLI